jgi:hypothetical protein
MATYIGDVFLLYNTFVSGLEGYTENKQLNDEKYVPGANADKNYFLEFKKKTSQTYSNNAEGLSMEFELKVIYQFPRKNDYAINEHDMWNAVDELERGLLDYSNTIDQFAFIDEINIENITEDYRLATLVGRIDYTRDLTYE